MTIDLVDDPMAKAKAKGKVKAKADRTAPVEPETRRNVVSIRGTERWRDWLMGLAAHRRLKASDVIDQALIEYAHKYGYTKEAPPR